MNRRTFLNSALAGAVSFGRAFSQSLARPNIVLINADDLGFGDLGCYGSRHRTPNINRLAENGARFTNFYSASSVCSPSRAALLTGRYPVRTGVTGVLDPDATEGLSRAEVTIPQLLQQAGYSTMCVGKWHLGRTEEYLPTSRGFNDYLGIPYSQDMWPRILLRNKTIVEEQVKLETLTDRYTSEATRFIAENGHNPFFLYYAPHAPHIPFAPASRFRRKSRLGPYGDVMMELDWSVGQIMQSLADHDLVNNTLVLFTSDNGPWYQGSAGPLRGRKGETWDGGMRVPLLARMPSLIPAGAVISELATTMDLLPTITRFANAPDSPHHLDGTDISPLLTSGAFGEGFERPPFLYMDDVNLQCARVGPWKLHVARYNTRPYLPAPSGGRTNLPLLNPELYNVSEDPQESYDCAEEYPDVVADIRSRIEMIVPSFPDRVQQAWRDTLARPVHYSPSGAVPIGKP